MNTCSVICGLYKDCISLGRWGGGGVWLEVFVPVDSARCRKGNIGVCKQKLPR